MVTAAARRYGKARSRPATNPMPDMPDAPDNPTDPIPTLDYAAPRRRLPWRAHPALVLVVATLLGLFALLMLGCALVGVVYSFRYGKRANRDKDLFECTMFLLIGAFSATIAVRWFKTARRDHRIATTPRPALPTREPPSNPHPDF